MLSGNLGGRPRKQRVGGEMLGVERNEEGLSSGGIFQYYIETSYQSARQIDSGGSCIRAIEPGGPGKAEEAL